MRIGTEGALLNLGINRLWPKPEDPLKDDFTAAKRHKASDNVTATIRFGEGRAARGRSRERSAIRTIMVVSPNNPTPTSSAFTLPPSLS
mmetsp:Transcript_9293/g.22858  ORF Transcript_9293/g.22858 Transcript_9293/m.22858 type:complete len:89 (+) Transcript_9293:2132-2398(+)